VQDLDGYPADHDHPRDEGSLPRATAQRPRPSLVTISAREYQMKSELKDLLIQIQNDHLNHAIMLKRFADAGVELDGDPSTIWDMVKREYDAAHGLKRTVDKMLD
jgi:hypothetical protein